VGRSQEKQAFRPTSSDAHESSILAEVLGLASIFLPGNRLALLEPYSINSPSPATHFPLCNGSLRPSTPLAFPREAAALPYDPRLAWYSTRRLVCITAYKSLLESQNLSLGCMIVGMHAFMHKDPSVIAGQNHAIARCHRSAIPFFVSASDAIVSLPIYRALMGVHRVNACMPQLG
jgi:hypothetical protein